MHAQYCDFDSGTAKKPVGESRHDTGCDRTANSVQNSFNGVNPVKGQWGEYLTRMMDLVELPQDWDLVHRDMQDESAQIPHHKKQQCVAGGEYPRFYGGDFWNSEGAV